MALYAVSTSLALIRLVANCESNAESTVAPPSIHPINDDTSRAEKPACCLNASSSSPSIVVYSSVYHCLKFRPLPATASADASSEPLSVRVTENADDSPRLTSSAAECASWLSHAILRHSPISTYCVTASLSAGPSRKPLRNRVSSSSPGRAAAPALIG